MPESCLENLLIFCDTPTFEGRRVFPDFAPDFFLFPLSSSKNIARRTALGTQAMPSVRHDVRLCRGTI